MNKSCSKVILLKRLFLFPKFGFTLIELLVAVSIIGVVFSIGIAKYQEFNRRQILVQAAQELKNNLRLAQDKALAGEKPTGCLPVLEGYKLSFLNESTYEIKAQCNGTYVSLGMFELPTGVTKGAGPDDVLFKVLAQGVENPGEFYLTADGRIEKVVVEEAGNIYREIATALPTVSPPAPTPTPTPTPILTPTPHPGLIFADDFETGDLSRWDYKTGGVTVSNLAKKEGNYGMQAVISGSPTMYVRDQNFSTSQYYARVYFNPNGITLSSAWNSDMIFLSLNGTTWGLGEVTIKANSPYFIRIYGKDKNIGWYDSSYLNISDGWHLIEIIWKAASCAGCNNGYAELIIDGASRYSNSNIYNGGYVVNSASLGVTRWGSTSGYGNGTVYFDDFYSAYTP